MFSAAETQPRKPTWRMCCAPTPKVPTNRRLQTARIIEDLTASYQAGWYSVIGMHGGGSPQAMTQEIYRHYPVGNKVELVERLMERGVVHDPNRPITANRQPGRCCAQGCTPPGEHSPHFTTQPRVRMTPTQPPPEGRILRGSGDWTGRGGCGAAPVQLGGCASDSPWLIY